MSGPMPLVPGPRFDLVFKRVVAVQPELIWRD